MMGEKTNEVRVKITNPTQLYLMAQVSGMIAAQEILEALPATLRQTPGMALAIASITAEANARRTEVISKNLATVAKAGHNIGNYKSIVFDPKTSDLVCEFYDPDLFDSEASA